jgi:ectoine hydroxylase-related dioxygenase (phytanoyl-CoA dioxygenase family)
MWERDTGNSDGSDRLLCDPDANHFGFEPGDVPGYPIESQPGDVVFFSHQIWHASFGGRTGRRIFTLEFRNERDG